MLNWFQSIKIYLLNSLLNQYSVLAVGQYCFDYLLSIFFNYEDDECINNS